MKDMPVHRNLGECTPDTLGAVLESHRWVERCTAGLVPATRGFAAVLTGSPPPQFRPPERG